jgi:uncharacterized protein YutE (UPF0331/DUF86 family)
MKINRQLVNDRMREIRDSVTKVRHYTQLPDAEFWSDERNLHTVLHLLLIALEAMGQLCAHILARAAQKAPASFAECMEGLQELGVVDEALAGQLTRMARFRNLVVHRYWQVDPSRVLTYARENLDDFDAYLAAVEQYLISNTQERGAIP